MHGREIGSMTTLKIILLTIIMTLIVVGVGYVAYTYGKQTAAVTQPTPIPTKTADSPTPTIVSGTSPITEMETTPAVAMASFTTEKVPDLSFSAYMVQYPTSWQKTITYVNPATGIKTGYTLTFSKNNYALKIYQAAIGGSVCLFDGDPIFDGPSQSFKDKQFVDLSGFGILRRVQTSSNNPQSVVFTVCQKGDGATAYYGIPTKVGAITYEAPLAYDQATIAEMDSIIKSIQVK